MKKSIYIIGMVCLAFVLVSAIVKTLHLPGAGIILFLGLGSMSFVFLPMAYSKLLKSTTDRWLRLVYTAAFVSFVIDFTGSLFKIMGWPGANIFLIIGIPLPFVVFLPLYVIYHNKRGLKTDVHFFALVLFMIYLGVFSSFLALDASKPLLHSYAHSANNIAASNNYLIQQLDDNKQSAKALELVNQLESIKQNLIEVADKDNDHTKSVFSKDFNYNNTPYKSIQLPLQYLINAGFNKFNQNFEAFNDTLSVKDADTTILKLVEEINKYRLPKNKGDYAKIADIPLIGVLNTLTDWQNKILLIAYEMQAVDL